MIVGKKVFILMRKKVFCRNGYEYWHNEEIVDVFEQGGNCRSLCKDKNNRASEYTYFVKTKVVK